MRLKKRPRVDALQNEMRARRGSLGRWLYLGAIAVFLIWLGDLFAGELVYFKADGLVLLDRVVIATQFPASIETVNIEEGDELTTGQPLLTVRSQSVEETLAELSSELALLLTRAAEMRVRAQVIEAITPVVRKNLSSAKAARASAENRTTRGLFTDLQRAQLSEQELSSVRTDAEVRAERTAIAADLPTIEAAVERAENALATLTDSYAGGALQAPTGGVVGYLHVAPGSVVRPGEPIMEIFHGEPFVLAFVPEGALYDVEAGDAVSIRLGFDQHDGVIERIYPVTAELPPEFADRFSQQRRAPLARIRLAPSETPPTLFARTQVTAKGWPPAWLKRLIGLNGSQAAARTAARTEERATAYQERSLATIAPMSDDSRLPAALVQDTAFATVPPLLAGKPAVTIAPQVVARIVPQPAARRPAKVPESETAAPGPAATAAEPGPIDACGDSKVLYWLEGGAFRATRLGDGKTCSASGKGLETAWIAKND